MGQVVLVQPAHTAGRGVVGVTRHRQFGVGVLAGSTHVVTVKVMVTAPVVQAGQLPLFVAVSVHTSTNGEQLWLTGVAVPLKFWQWLVRAENVKSRVPSLGQTSLKPAEKPGHMLPCTSISRA